MYCLFHTCVSFRKKMSSRTLVIPRAWVRNKVVSLTKKDQEENVIESLNWWWSTLEKADTQFSEQRVRSHEESSKAKEMENSLHTCADVDTIETVFRAMIPVNQFSIYVAVSYMCEECSTCQTRTARPYWQDNLTHCLCQQVRWWKHPHFRPMILRKKKIGLSIEILAQETWLQKYKKRVEKLPQQYRLMKICIDARFRKLLKSDNTSWQNILTCREHTLPRDDKPTDPKVGTPKLDP